jgi:hypothetical protein
VLDTGRAIVNARMRVARREESLLSSYPKPDRSNFRPNAVRTPEREIVDVGWGEGVLSDGRPFRLEWWAEDQVTYLQCLFSTLGLEKMEDPELSRLLESEGIARFRSAKRYITSQTISDASGNEMWSVNIVLGDEDETYIDCDVPLRTYR